MGPGLGEYGNVTRLHDRGLTIRTDDGRPLHLFHHDMAGHGNALDADRRVFVQLRWGWLWTGTLGISVFTDARAHPCTQAPTPPPRAAVRSRSALPGVPGVLDCALRGRGHQPYRTSRGVGAGRGGIVPVRAVTLLPP